MSTEVSPGSADVKGKPWRVQWHLTPDGRVIQQRSRGEGAHQQLFQEFETTRPQTVADLVELDQRLAAAQRTFNVVAWPVLGVASAGLAVAVVGIVLGLFGVEHAFAAGLVGFGVAFVGMLVNPLLVRWHISRHQRVWREAGFASHQGVTISARDAVELVRAPGTQSGPVVRKKRA